MQLPVFIRKLAPNAMDGCRDICIRAFSVDQTESWQPLLRAQRAVLKIPGEGIWLPLSRTGGFEPALPERAVSEADKPQGGGIDFRIYDSRFSRIQDRDLKLDIAISRLLYPAKLEESARAAYENLVKNRFRPAMLWLVSGKWNQYGAPPDGAKKLLCLKKIDRFLKKELLQKAAASQQPEFSALIIEVTNAAQEKHMEAAGGEAERKEGMKDPLEESLWKMAACRLYRRKPEMESFCGMLTFCQLDVRKDGVIEAVPAAGTDGTRIYYTRGFMEAFAGKADADEREVRLARLYTHMLFHCLYLHPFSRKRKGRFTDIACDIAVEYAVDQTFGPAKRYAWERQWVYDMLRRSEKVLTAEKVEEQLFQWEKEDMEENAGRPGGFFSGLWPDEIFSGAWPDDLARWFSCDEHGFWETGRMEKAGKALGAFQWERDSKMQREQKLWQEEAKRWISAGKGLLQAGQKKAGKRFSLAGHEQEEAALKKRKGHDYHDFLKQFMVLKEDRILDLDSYDPIYYTYGLNAYGNIPLVEPLETKEVLRLEELVIVIDTSGSCSGKLVRFFLEETWSVFGQAENFFDQFHVRLLQCDATVQEDVKLTSLQEAEQYMKRLTIKGGGETDFREAFSYIRKLQKQGELMHLKGILYFTDGFGTYPVRPPGCRTAFIFLKARFGQVEVPYWADKLLLELPEGADWEPEYTGGFEAAIRR